MEFLGEPGKKISARGSPRKKFLHARNSPKKSLREKIVVLIFRRIDVASRLHGDVRDAIGEA
jgi:hypothetical protein